MSTDAGLDVAPILTDEDGGHDLFAHIVKKDDILPSAISGIPITAICGKTWVPTRDPKQFPICPDCKSIMEGALGPGSIPNV